MEANSEIIIKTILMCMETFLLFYPYVKISRLNAEIEKLRLTSEKLSDDVTMLEAKVSAERCHRL